VLRAKIVLAAEAEVASRYRPRPRLQRGRRADLMAPVRGVRDTWPVRWPRSGGPETHGPSALGQPSPLDWYDIYKAWEIVGNAVGGPKKVAAEGWASEAAINRLTASANHPGISGDDARHARMKGAPGQNLTITMSEADALVRHLIANWIESHPSY